jgi:peroxiredoxin
VLFPRCFREFLRARRIADLRFEYAELSERVHLPSHLLSDENLELVTAAGLPTIEWQGSILTKRLTMAVGDGKIVKVWYPVFPPDKNAGEVLEWLKARN